MDVHPTKIVSIGIDPYPYVCVRVFVCILCAYMFFLCMCFSENGPKSRGLNMIALLELPVVDIVFFLSNPYHMFGLIPSCSNDIQIKWLVSHV